VSADAEHVRRLLGHDELRWLIDRARRRLERGQPLQGWVVLPRPEQAQRRAVERLLGRPVRPGEALAVRLESVQVTLVRAGAAPDLRSAVEVLTGPVVDGSMVQAALGRAWDDALAPLEETALRRPVLAPWSAAVRSTGLLRRLARGDPIGALVLSRQAVRVIERLPAGGVPLSVLANTVSDGHALDAGRPLSSLVIRAASRLGSVPDGEGAEWRRTVWASVGVLAGELTSPVLCLNLPGDTGTPSGRAIAAWSQVGQPVHLTARQLLRHPPALQALRGREVFVCENPTVVAEAANELGPRCAPLVCCSGHPAGAATLLLRMLTHAGANLRYHGDFDWPGISIANGIVVRFEAEPWRFDAGSYRHAAGSGGPKLRGRPVQAVWDPQLTEAMLTIGIKIEEERVLSALLEDLSSGLTSL
jgi:uncharacterized protein (TIGR02679 family)